MWKNIIKIMIFCLPVLTTWACKEPANRSKTPECRLEMPAVHQTVEIPVTNKDQKIIDNSDAKYSAGIVRVVFPEFELSINGLDIWDEEDLLDDVIDRDTVYLFTAIGESIEGLKLVIESKSWSDIRVEHRYETTATIQDEGPHCDLFEWKHEVSKWETIKRGDDGSYWYPSYEELCLSCSFPKFDLEELKMQVREACGEYWYDFVKDKTTDELPLGIGISSYFLRISGMDKQSGMRKSKMVMVLTPLGC